VSERTTTFVAVLYAAFGVIPIAAMLTAANGQVETPAAILTEASGHLSDVSDNVRELGDIVASMEPVTAPQPMSSVLSQSPANAVAGSLSVSGGTRYEVTGLTDVTLVDGVLSVGPESKPELLPYGYVSVDAEAGAEIRIKAEKIEKSQKVRLSVSPFSGGYKVDGEGLVYVDVTAVTKQTVTIDGTPVEFIKSYEQAEIQFVIETTSGPDPPPDDDDDDTEPSGENPFGNVSGLHVLIVHERDDPISIDQQEILYSAPMRQWLAEIGANSRILDQNSIFAGSNEVWEKALARQRDGLPWILIGNGDAGYEGELPENMTAAKELIARFK
jgi:hypothetical protein